MIVCTCRFYFEYIPEWSVIIGASNWSSEVAVLGSEDNGTTWTQWQLVDSGRAQLPLHKIKKVEPYPLGLAVQKSTVERLPWGADSFLPNAVPILHTLGTSGQLYSFHIVHLAPNCPAICSPPTESLPVQPVKPTTLESPPVVASPPVQHVSPPQQIIPTYKVSASPDVPSVPLNQAITITPAARPAVMPEISFNLGQNATSTPRAKMPEVNFDKPKVVADLFGKAAEKSKVAAATSMPPPAEALLKPKVTLLEKVEIPVVAAAEPKVEPPKEVVKEKPHYDDSLCLKAFQEEQMHFQKELQCKLEPCNYECGTEAERVRLVELSTAIEQFLNELRETTSSLTSDIACLKFLLLQSFAWLEETKSKNASNTSNVINGSREDSTLAELQRLFYYTQSQLMQASRALDLDWAERKDKDKCKITIPSLEYVYQGMMKHSQIIEKEKGIIASLLKKWRALSRGNTVSSLNKSLNSLSIASTGNMTTVVRNNVIETRCKAIASKALNFTERKQSKLRSCLLEKPIKIIKPASPSKVQDRLEATLSSLASMKPELPATASTKQTQQQSKPKPLGAPQKVEDKPSVQSPLLSLNSIVDKIGSSLKSPHALPLSLAFGTKVSQPQAISTPPMQSNVISTSMGQVAPKPVQQSSFVGNSAAKGQEPAKQQQQSVLKENLADKITSNGSVLSKQLEATTAGFNAKANLSTPLNLLSKMTLPVTPQVSVLSQKNSNSKPEGDGQQNIFSFTMPAAPKGAGEAVPTMLTSQAPSAQLSFPLKTPNAASFSFASKTPQTGELDLSTRSFEAPALSTNITPDKATSVINIPSALPMLNFASKTTTAATAPSTFLTQSSQLNTYGLGKLDSVTITALPPLSQASNVTAVASKPAAVPATTTIAPTAAATSVATAVTTASSSLSFGSLTLLNVPSTVPTTTRYVFFFYYDFFFLLLK